MSDSVIPSPTLWHIGWRSLVRHPLQTALMIVGIMLGVSVVVAIDLANESASRAFDLSIESVAGRATHQIIGSPSGLDEGLYASLKQVGVIDAAAPVISEYVRSPQLGDQPINLLGVDPFEEGPFRSYLYADSNIPLEELVNVFTTPNTVLISTELADKFGLQISDEITLLIGGRERQATIAGLLRPSDDLSRRALQGLILADISTVQELTDREGKLDSIDLILPEQNATQLEHIESLLPDGVRVIPVEARTGTVQQMTKAFRINLTALSLLALLVGLFLIYNTMTFAVVQRRSLFGTLRCLGVTRREVFSLVVSEALIVGIIGSLLGIGLGVLMGQSAVRMVTQTINDLYFVVTVRGIQIPIASLIKGILLGMSATVLTAAVPAWEAASVPPRAALSRSGLENKAKRAVTYTAISGSILAVVGVGVLLWPTNDLVISFIGTFAVVLGIAMLTPATMILLMQIVSPLTARLWGVLGRVAPRSVVGSLSRTSIAVAALMVAVAVTIGVGVMIRSFRNTVVIWLEQTLQGDIYISVPGGTASSPSAPIDPEVIEALQQIPEIARLDQLRATTVDSPHGPIDLSAFNNPDEPNESIYYSRDLPVDDIWQAMQEREAILVSEPLARRLNLPKNGGELTLYTEQGERTFPVIAIYYDYASSEGTILMAHKVYKQWWNDDEITAVSVHLNSGVNVDEKVSELKQFLSPIQQLSINPNQALRSEVLTIFDRTFAITGALQLLATIVAFIGVLSALLSLQLEKQREFGVLRAVGLTTRQLWQLILLETGLMGSVAGVLAAPTGYILSLILIYIINRRAFGWTLQMLISPQPFIFALIVAVGAALLAGIYPAQRMSALETSDAIRFE